MNGLIDLLFNWLVFSGVLIVILVIFMLTVRSILLSKNIARTVVLKLWLAIPLGLLVSWICTHLMSQTTLLEPVIFQLPVEIEFYQVANENINWKLLLLLFWLTIFMVKLFHFLIKFNQFKQLVMNCSTQQDNNLFYTSLHTTPMAFGLLRPVVVIPEYLQKELSEQELKLTIMHEQVHCRRADPLWKFCLNILSLLYWFLPGSRIKMMLEEDQEVSCDELVVMQSQQLINYAQLLLKLNVSLRTEQRFSPAMLCSTSSNLKERIMKLNQKKNQKHQGKIISMFILVVLAVGTVSAIPKFGSTEPVQLEPVNTVPPKYPIKAYQAKLTGEVKLQFVVATDGAVKNVEVVESTPTGVFDKAAINAMQQWKFKPIEIETKAQQTLKFKMD